MEEFLLSVDNVSKSFGLQKVLNNVNFNLQHGEVVGLVGPNGAGKSTIMKIISGLIMHYEGNVYINQKNIKKYRTNHRLIGCMIESPGFNLDDTGANNLKFVSKISGRYDLEEIRKVVAMLELDDAMDKKVKNYSLGMKQRLGLCQSILGKPEVLILDEPTNGLDPSIILIVRNFISNAAKELNMGVLVSSHILSEIEAVCGRVFFINKGNIVQDVSMSNTAKDFFVYETNMCTELSLFFKQRNIESSILDNKVLARVSEEQAKVLLQDIVKEGIMINSMYVEKESLEDQYKEIILGGKSNEKNY